MTLAGMRGTALCRWFLREPAPDSPARLFCVPYSGCGASSFRSWPRFIGPIEVCPIQLPGRENRMREPTFGSYEALACDLLAAIRPYLDRPYAFFGHCGAALPSYEITMQLSSTSCRQPSRLFVSSQVAPHHGPFGRFLVMQDHELGDEILSLMRQMGNEPPPSFVEVALSILRADVEANKRYRRNSPGQVPCPITAFGWDGDEEVDARLMAGWEDCGATTFRTLHGKHYEFLKAPAALLEAIQSDLSLEVTESASL